MPGQRNNSRKEQSPAELGYGHIMPQAELGYGHIMPQAPEVEKAVLGALMIDSNAYMEVCDRLRPESFYEPRNQLVYEAIVKLSVDESPVEWP